MDFYRTGEAPANDSTQECDPDVFDKEIIETYEKMLNAYLCENAQSSAKNIFFTPLRLVDDKKIYGAYFIHALLSRFVEVGLIAKEKLDDFNWQLSFSALLHYVRKLLIVMQQPNIKTIQ